MMMTIHKFMRLIWTYSILVHLKARHKKIKEINNFLIFILKNNSICNILKIPPKSAIIQLQPLWTLKNNWDKSLERNLVTIWEKNTKQLLTFIFKGTGKKQSQNSKILWESLKKIFLVKEFIILWLKEDSSIRQLFLSIS